jgi:hypothetical protein
VAKDISAALGAEDWKMVRSPTITRFEPVNPRRNGVVEVRIGGPAREPVTEVMFFAPVRE